MFDRLGRFLGIAALVVLCGVPSACARPLGDFGRPKPSVLHDEVLPFAGKVRAGLTGEPVSRFNLSDQERDMHNRVWRFLVAPHADGWFMDTVVELQRTRIVGAVDHRFDPARYYRWLRQTRYESSRTRYRTVSDHARTDADLSPSVFRSICRVIEVDRQRAVASRELRGLAYDEVVARRAENDMFIGWFARALRYRYEAYDNALDHLLVETPHEQAVETDGRIGELALYVDLAERGEFCLDAAFHAVDRSAGGIPSRLLTREPGEGEYLK